MTGWDATWQDMERDYLKGGDRVLKEGEQAPNFTTVDHTGKEVRLAGLGGKKVWLWFYSSPGGSN